MNLFDVEIMLVFEDGYLGNLNVLNKVIKVIDLMLGGELFVFLNDK